jgi:hypothetical protein
MSFGLGNFLMLAGLAGMTIPVLVHLLHRRRFNVVPWGAMQFLQISQKRRRRFLLEEILLLLVRMTVVALLVLGLAAPYVTGPLVAGLPDVPGRDVVLVFDGSASMGLDDGKNPTPQEEAKAWAGQFLDSLGAADAVAVLVAQQKVLPVLPELTPDLSLVREKIAGLPRPHGGCDGPESVRQALRLHETQGRNASCQVVVLTDGRRHGWTDSPSLFQWENLAAELSMHAHEGTARPQVWLIAVGKAQAEPAPVPNYALRPLQPKRGLTCVGQLLTVRTALTLTGQKAYQPPYRMRLEADGEDVGTIEAPARASLQNGQVPLEFSHRFKAPGAHLLSVIVEPDPPIGRRKPSAPLRDQLPADNRQDLAVEVVDHLPVLLLDGDKQLSPESSTWFLRKALAQSPEPGRPAVVLARALPAQDFDPTLLRRDVDPTKPGSRPRVLILADVPALTEAQQRAVELFLRDGGGALVILGLRVEKSVAVYNYRLFQDGKGWLPARLRGLAGNTDQKGPGAAVNMKQLHHPALEMFRDEPGSTLDRARFPRWWRVQTAGQGSAVVGAWLTTGDPLLVEKPFGKGRVLLWTVPMDRSWETDLPTTWEFPVLAHELVYHLADSRSGELNVQPGQPLRFRSGLAMAQKLPASALLYPPDGPPQPLNVEHWPYDCVQARATGVYKLQVGGGPPAWFVVQPDPEESDLTPCRDEDWKGLASLVPVHYGNEPAEVVAPEQDSSQALDLWWLVLIGVMAMLCGEVWLTRRMALR